MKRRKNEPGVKAKWEEPWELLGWVDENDRFYRLCDGNRWEFSARGYGWRPVFAVR